MDTPVSPSGKIQHGSSFKGVRVTINAKQFNKRLVHHKRPMPTIVELTNDLAGSKWFSCLDFQEAFSQLEYDEESRALMAMSTKYGLYYWDRLSMGVATASEIFQEVMQSHFEDLKKNLKVAIDDLLLHHNTKDEAQQALNKVLDRISDMGMALNKDKCVFIAEEVSFFGVTISAAGVKPKQSKVHDLKTCLPPINAKQVQSYLGLTSYFKSRSPYQSSIDKPLRDLVKKGAKFKWEQEQEAAFQRLKNIIIEEELAFFDHKKVTELYVDAGPFGCSSFLTQLNSLKDEIKLVKCDSHAFNEAELNYSHLEKEAFACVWTCKTNHI